MRRIGLPGLFVAAALATGAVAEEPATGKDPVSGREIQITRETPHVLLNGKALHFESAASRDAFLKQPERYLKAPLPCPVLTTESLPDRQRRLVVNDGLWYFCCGDCVETALNQPFQYFGRLTDPVTGKPFQVSPDSPRAFYKGSHYFFANPESKAKFVQEPAKYARVVLER